MNFYHKQGNVALYKDMTRDYDACRICAKVKEVLPLRCTLLELGMGLGKDLLALSKYYRVTGSDYSPLFLDEFCSKHPEIEVLEVNAANFSLNNKFDCIYSNKVLYHLSAPEFRRSLQLQAEHLNDQGMITHENTPPPASRIVHTTRIYYPLLYGSIVSYRRAYCKSGVDLTLTS